MKIKSITYGYNCNTEEADYPIKITIGDSESEVISIKEVVNRCRGLTKRHRGNAMIVLTGNSEDISFEEVFNLLAYIIFEHRYSWKVLISLRGDDTWYCSDSRKDALSMFKNVYII